MNKKRDKLFFLIASLALAFSLYFKFVLYKGLESLFFSSMIIIIFINALISIFIKREIYSQKNFIHINIILLLMMAGLIFTRPGLTYKEAGARAEEYGVEEFAKAPFNTAVILTEESSLEDAYLFKGKLKGEYKYILVGSKDGQIKLEDIGKSFIDQAIEHREKKKK